ncbi:MAG: transglutaminase-like putative cysteine protease [Hyphomicrobiaceae bacterium]|jgi:transglutaminase-like putative cysteine protease
MRIAPKPWSVCAATGLSGKATAICFSLAATLLLSVNVAVAEAPPVANDEQGATAEPEIERLASVPYVVNARAEIELPQNAKRVRVWFALPRQDDSQSISDLNASLVLTKAPQPDEIVEDAADPVVPEPETDDASKHESKDGDGELAKSGESKKIDYREIQDDFGNRFGFAEFASFDGAKLELRQKFKLLRQSVRIDLTAAATRPANDSEREEHRRALEPTVYEMVTPYIAGLATEITADNDDPAAAIRAIYDWSLVNLDIWFRDPERLSPSGVGSAIYAASTRGGDCRDLGSLFISLARSRGIPARAVEGVVLAGVEGKGHRFRAGYPHCWVEAWSPGYGWFGIDLALGDLYDEAVVLTDANREVIKELAGAAGASVGAAANPEKRSAALLALDARRMTWTVGREPVLDPAPRGSRPDRSARLRVEVDGKVLDPVAYTVQFKEGAASAPLDAQ